MTEGELNLLVLQVESRLEAMCSHKGPGMTREAVVGARWLASVLVDNEHLRQQVTEVQATNTALQERARKAEADRCAVEGEIAPSRELAAALAEQCKELHADRMLAIRERNVARANVADVTKRLDATGADLARATKDLAVERAALRLEREQHSRVIEQWEAAKASHAEARTEMQRALFACEGARRERDEARAALAAEIAAHEHERHQHAVTRKERDEAMMTVGANGVACPTALVRLYVASQRARAKWGAPAQRVKLVEECGEYVVDFARTGERYDVAKVTAEAHDVLTVALSLSEPALMAKSAERLEARLK